MATIEAAKLPIGDVARVPDRLMIVEDASTRMGGYAIIVSLSIIFLWFGCLKFTSYEESGIAGFVLNNPLITWIYGVFGTGGGGQFLGIFEIATGLLIAGRLVNPRLGLIGGLMGMFTFFITLVCLLTTPGVIQPGFDGPFALSAVPGQFLLKDLGLFAACLWIAGTSLSQIRASRRLV